MLRGTHKQSSLTCRSLKKHQFPSDLRGSAISSSVLGHLHSLLGCGELIASLPSAAESIVTKIKPSIHICGKTRTSSYYLTKEDGRLDDVGAP